MRKQFYEKYGNRNETFWQRVIFGNETRISILESNKPPLVRRPKNQPLNFEYLRPKFEKSISVMVWGCI